ncbi:Na+/H+ antiporter NhaC family protein [Helicobacter cholecystus]|uniref:Na+/H+ antiporter NhaC family protein n=1 Tax=Helicobacter cholecystus TaxID=45498 RepID=A0A3D8IX49_9HELI|nr:Na+/H+ antiporter NhaC family protein [Helicobacter cholecystus]VEJ24036.1 putative cation antiporter [Helicobacter cholecystus]
MNYSDTFFSLFVPLAVIVLVLLSKRIVLSLFVGIVLGGIMMHYQEPLHIFSYVYEKISSVFYEYSPQEGLSANWGGIYVFLFLLSLGILSQVVLVCGGVAAFVEWARSRVKDTRTSEFVAFFAGIVIFIDDYFNALTVGQIAKPLSAMHQSSRERLAYIIDSTSAPICVLVPISSWGAYIIGILQSSLPKDQGNALFVLFGSIGGNFYAWFALIAVFLTILWQINLPVMRKNINVSIPQDHQGEYPPSKISLLLLPIVALIFCILFMIFYTGYKTSGSFEILTMLANCDTPFSLFCGGMIALLFSLILSHQYIAPYQYTYIVYSGVKAMLPAIVILVLAWAIGPVIKEDLKTGLYLANLAKENLSSQTLLLLPFSLFLVSAFISFSTGTSWGCFAIMIPIAIELSLQSGGNMIIAISAVLSGAVYGDHTSPMSDTTILSSIGAGCSLQSHFITQLPYAGICAFFAGGSFLIFSLTQSILISFVICAMGLIGVFWLLKVKFGGELQGV